VTPNTPTIAAMPVARVVPVAPVAEWPMLQELDSEVSQQVFHATMRAFARPGTVHRLPEASVPAPVPAVVTPLLALADIMTPIAGIAAGGPDTPDTEIAAAIAVAARLVNTRVVGQADARFALAFAEPDDLSTLNRGSHWSPEAGAMLFQRVTAIETVTDALSTGAPSTPVWRLTGPGVKPSEPVLLRVAGLSDRFVAERAERVSDYPSGIDVLLVTDEGELVGLSRTTVIEVI